MRQKIILHCGAPKTGSTSFQHLLYDNRALLLSSGIFCPAVTRKKHVKDDVRILLQELRSSKDKDAIRNVRRVIDETFSVHKAHTLVISNEAIIGAPFSAKHGAFYKEAAWHVPAIAAALDGYDVDVRFFVRDYAGFLPSWYVQYVRMGGAMEFAPYIDQIDVDRMSWTTIVGIFRREFGQERVMVLDHGAFVADPAAALARAFPSVMAVLGDRGRGFSAKNPSIGKGMVETYRRWNMISMKIAPSIASRKWLHHMVRRFILMPLERFSRSDKLRLDGDLAKKLSMRYATELAMIQAEEGGP